MALIDTYKESGFDLFAEIARGMGTIGMNLGGRSATFYSKTEAQEFYELLRERKLNVWMPEMITYNDVYAYRVGMK